MNKRQFFLYFTILLLVFDKGGVLALMPDYAAQLGAPPALVGYYLAFCFLTLAIGTFVAPAVARRVKDLRPLLIMIGLVKIPVIFLHGQVGDVWQLMALNGLDWFMGGIVIVIINISVGLTARANERGRMFGLLAMASSIGEVAGGFLASAVIGQGGYDRLFAVFSITACVSPVAAFFLAPVSARTAGEPAPALAAKPLSGLGFDLFVVALLAAAVMAKTAAFGGTFGMSIAMLAKNSPLAEISLAGALGNSAGLIVPLVVGWLSDRVGRRSLMVVIYALCIPSLVILIFGSVLGHFALSSVLRNAYLSGANTLGPALLTDVVSRDRLPRALSWWGNSGWIGGIVAFAGMGNAIQAFGLTATLTAGVALIVAATLITTWLLAQKTRAPVSGSVTT